jgi:hypothetical protein
MTDGIAHTLVCATCERRGSCGPIEAGNSTGDLWDNTGCHHAVDLHHFLDTLKQGWETGRELLVA